MRYSISLVILLLLLASCGVGTKNAEYYLEQSKGYYAAGNDTLAIEMLDSVSILFPKDIPNRRLADTLRWQIQMKQCITALPLLDSVIASAQYQLDSLVKYFRFFKDSLYQDIGTYEHRILTTERNTSRCYLKPSVDENGAVTITSFYYGARAHHNQLKVSVDSFFVETPVIPSENISDFQLDESEYKEVIIVDSTYLNGIDEYIAANADRKIRITLKGDNPYVYYLNGTEKEIFYTTYQFANILSIYSKAINQKSKAIQKIEILKQRNIKLYDYE
ncbi:MAG: hypothetical protein ACI3ZX_01895 [Candidatus Aphodosoma sp.]